VEGRRRVLRISVLRNGELAMLVLAWESDDWWMGEGKFYKGLIQHIKNKEKKTENGDW
jgi:hypothetical protein